MPREFVVLWVLAICSLGVAAEIDPLVRVIDLNVGESQRIQLSNGREVAVSLLDLRERRDSIRNAVREANARRTGRQAILNRGRMAGASAANLRTTAGAMNPYFSGATSLVGGAGQVASSWHRYNRTT